MHSSSQKHHFLRTVELQTPIILRKQSLLLRRIRFFNVFSRGLIHRQTLTRTDSDHLQLAALERVVQDLAVEVQFFLACEFLLNGVELVDGVLVGEGVGEGEVGDLVFRVGEHVHELHCELLLPLGVNVIGIPPVRDFIDEASPFGLLFGHDSINWPQALTV